MVAAQGGRWVHGIPPELVVVAGAIGYYVWGGRESDLGAMIGSRADERQNLLRMRARSFAGQAMVITAAAGTVVAVALNDPIWPFAIFLGVGTVSFLAGLAIYRTRDVG